MVRKQGGDERPANLAGSARTARRPWRWLCWCSKRAPRLRRKSSSVRPADVADLLGSEKKDKQRASQDPEINRGGEAERLRSVDDAAESSAKGDLKPVALSEDAAPLSDQTSASERVLASMWGKAETSNRDSGLHKDPLAKPNWDGEETARSDDGEPVDRGQQGSYRASVIAQPVKVGRSSEGPQLGASRSGAPPDRALSEALPMPAPVSKPLMHVPTRNSNGAIHIQRNRSMDEDELDDGAASMGPEGDARAQWSDVGPAPEGSPDELFLCLRVVALPNGKSGGIKIVHPGEGEMCKIGRHWRCGLVVDDGEVSGEHCVVAWSEDSPTGWVVADLGSLNGTRLNDESIGVEGRIRGVERPLGHGDLVSLASETVVQVSLLTEEEAEEVELAGAPGKMGGALGGKGAAMLRKANQGATMRRREDSSEDEGYAFLERGASRQDLRVTEVRDDAGACSVSAPGLQLVGSLRVRQGLSHARDQRPCEDQVVVCLPASKAGLPGGILAVLDGHFGTRAAIMARHQLAGVAQGFFAQPPGERGYGPALETVFADVDRTICEQCEEGCTATVVPVWAHGGRVHMQVANVGDSLAVFAGFGPEGDLAAGPEPRELTQNHRVDQDAEYDRIAAYNLPPEKLGGYERGHTRLLGFQLARCLGDRMFKQECPAIVSKPSVSEVVEVPSTGGVLIVASDGLWDGITTTEAANMVRQMIAGPRDMVPEKVAEARDKLVEKALENRSKDDISVAVFVLHPHIATTKDTSTNGRVRSVPRDEREGMSESDTDSDRERPRTRSGTLGLQPAPSGLQPMGSQETSLGLNGIKADPKLLESLKL